VLTPNVKYDSERDFEPIGLTTHSPAVIVARRDFPAANAAEFIAYLKQNSDRVKEAHGGVGASSHMACLLFNQALNIKPTLVAYRELLPQ
jgi:tripartite-type tricarboxylate transporter receptor subunit TctC